MGNCVHCGKPAGWFKSSHHECSRRSAEYDAKARKEAEEREKNRGEFERSLLDSLAAGAPLVELDASMAVFSESQWLTQDERSEMLAKGWRRLVDASLEDGLLSDEEIARLESIRERFQLPINKLMVDRSFERYQEASVVRSVIEGDPVFIQPPPGLNLRRGEGVVWVFDGVNYLEDRVRRRTVGGSHGVSLRIAKGVYYRVGAFKGESVSSTERVMVDRGYLAVTNEALCFVSASKSVRVPYDKIVSFDRFSDGIGIMRDTQTAKPQIFVTGDGWFSYNLIVNLAQM